MMKGGFKTLIVLLANDFYYRTKTKVTFSILHILCFVLTQRFVNIVKEMDKVYTLAVKSSLVKSDEIFTFWRNI